MSKDLAHRVGKLAFENVKLSQSTLVMVRDTMYSVTVFIKPAPGSSLTVWFGAGLGESPY